MTKCSYCGTEVDDLAQSCPSCGAPVLNRRTTLTPAEQPISNGLSGTTVSRKTNKLFPVVSIAIAIFLVCVLIFAVTAMNDNDAAISVGQTSETHYSDVQPEPESPAEEPVPQEYEAEPDNDETPAPQYILPESNSRYLSRSDVAELSSAVECRLARNEIYARHGRKFKDKSLQEYFNNCSWYTPSIPANQFNNKVLNKYEKANINLIMSYEKEQGYR